jgi:hypothetical protein
MSAKDVGISGIHAHHSYPKYVPTASRDYGKLKGRLNMQKEVMKTETENQIDMFSSLYEKLTDGSFAHHYYEMASMSFENCMALAAMKSFGPTEHDLRLSLKLCQLSEQFMFLTGRDETPDEMPWALYAIKANAMATLGAMAQVGPKAEKTERDFERDIIDNFNEISHFKNFVYVGSQIKLKCGDRVDIVAREVKTQRDVLIELKLGGISGHKQLRSYAVDFNDPILINISTQMPKNTQAGIEYLTYSTIGIDLIGKSVVPNLPPSQGLIE